MALQYECPACPTDCTEAALPVIISEDCPEAVVLEQSEIVALYIGLPDPDDPTEIDGTIDMSTASGIETAKTNGDLLVLPVIGDMPVPERTTVTLPRGLEKRKDGAYSINADFFDLSIANYDGLRALQCGLKVRFFFETMGGYIYGGDHGIYGQVASVEFPKERGQESYARAQLILTWRSSCDPEKIISPFAQNPPETEEEPEVPAG